MRIERIRLKNFRNIEDAEVIPGPRLNFFVGPNAQGKTSLLEAIEYCSSLQSFRSAKPFDLVRSLEEGAEAFCELRDDTEPGGAATHLQVRIHDVDEEGKKARRSLFLHGKRVPSAVQYYRLKQDFSPSGFRTVVFNPSDHALVHGEPRERRAFLDHAISSGDYGYLETLQKYQRALEQRNACLREEHREGFEEFSAILFHEGASLLASRMRWWQEMDPVIASIASALAPKQAPLAVEYRPALGGIDLSMRFPLEEERLSPSYWAVRLQESAKRRASAEWEAGTTLFGPHRDDWVFFLGSEGLAKRGSQGEVRTSCLALKLAQVELTEGSLPGSTVFLLDDFSSELDPSRRRDLLDYLDRKGLQAFITTTENHLGSGATFHVAGGRFSRQEFEGRDVERI